MSIFKQGYEYPPQDVRLDIYNRNSKLFLGNHREGFLEVVGYLSNVNPGRWANLNEYRRTVQFTQEKLSNVGFLQLNFISLTARIYADLIAGRGLSVRVQDEKSQHFIDELIERSKFDHLIYESILQLSYAGDANFKLYRDIDGLVQILEIRPENYFVTFDAMNSRKVYSVTETSTFQIGEHQFLLQETHYQGFISYTLNHLEKGKVGASVDPLSIFPGLYPSETMGFVETGIDSLLCYHIPNFRNPGEYWGSSDVSNDVLALQLELDNRLSQVAEILDKHARPKMIVPKGVLDQNKKVQNSALEFFEMNPGNPLINQGGKPIEPKYIVWDAKLDSNFKEIDNLTNQLLWATDISPVLLYGVDSPISDSGKSIELKLSRVLSKMSGKKNFIIPVLKKMFFDAQALGGLAPAPVDIIFNPSDVERLASEWKSVALFNVKAQSLYQTIKVAHPDWSEQLIEQEIQRIREDNRSATKPSNTEGRNPDNMLNNPGNSGEEA